MDDMLKQALENLLATLAGPNGPAPDTEIMSAQAGRAGRILTRPAMPPGSLFELEPSSHAALLARLADGQPT